MKNTRIRQFKTRTNLFLALVAISFMTAGIISAEQVNSFVQACQPSVLPFDLANKFTVFLLSNFV